MIEYFVMRIAKQANGTFSIWLLYVHVRIADHVHVSAFRRIHDICIIYLLVQVYGDPLQHPQTEAYWGNVNPIGERSCYDEGKRVAETLAFDYQREHGIEVCLRSWNHISGSLQHCLCILPYMHRRSYILNTPAPALRPVAAIV